MCAAIGSHHWSPCFRIHAGVLTYRQIRDRAFSKNVLSLVRREKHGRGLASLLFAEEIMGALGAMSVY